MAHNKNAPAIASHRIPVDERSTDGLEPEVPCHPVDAIDEMLHGMAVREPDALDWFVIHTIAERANRWLRRTEGDGAPGFAPPRKPLLTHHDNQWHPLLRALSDCRSSQLMQGLLAVIDNQARRVLFDHGLQLTPAGWRRRPRPPLAH